MAKNNKGKGKENQDIKNQMGRSNRKSRNRKDLTHEISNVTQSPDSQAMTFWHKDDKKLYVNVPICHICGGHHPRGSMTVCECDGHSGVKEELRPAFAKRM